MSCKSDLFWYWSANCGQSRVLPGYCSKWGRPCGWVSTSWRGQRHGWVPELPSYALATCVLFFPPTYLNTDCQLFFFLFFSRPSVSTGYGHWPSTRYSYLHSFMWTHQRGRGDELSTRIHHDRTWWSGQPSKLVIIRGLLCKERNTWNTSKKIRQRADSAPSLPGTTCAKLRCHTSKVKISFKPNVVTKNGTLGNTHKCGNSIATCTKL